jgi:hypothetical protein
MKWNLSQREKDLLSSLESYDPIVMNSFTFVVVSVDNKDFSQIID